MLWSDVQLFVAVVRHGTVRGAARALGIDPSTVSRRIASLESGMGVRLFERTSAGLLLTPSGRLMVESGERVDGELEDLRRRIAGQDRKLTGVVRVSLPGSFSTIVHAAAAAFAERHPAIELELLTLDALVDVDGRQADVAIRVADQPPANLVGRRLARMAAALYASHDYLRRHPEPLEAKTHAWIDWDRRLSAKPAFAWMVSRFPERRVAVRGLSTADVAFAAAAGAGIGPLPCIVGDADPSLVRLVDAPKDVWSSVWLLTHAELRPAARVRAAMSHFAAAIHDERARIEGERPRAPKRLRAQA